MKAFTNFPFAHRPKTIMICADDLVEYYGLSRDSAYQLLHKHGVQIGGRWYIKREKADKLLDGPGTIA